MCASCGCGKNVTPPQGLEQANWTGRPEDKYGKYDGVGGTNNPGNSK